MNNSTDSFNRTNSKESFIPNHVTNRLMLKLLFTNNLIQISNWQLWWFRTVQLIHKSFIPKR